MKYNIARYFGRFLNIRLDRTEPVVVAQRTKALFAPRDQVVEADYVVPTAK
jgi:hypothetical protein